MDAFNNPEFETDHGIATFSPTDAEGLTRRDVDETHLLRVTAAWANMLAQNSNTEAKDRQRRAWRHERRMARGRPAGVVGEGV